MELPYKNNYVHLSSRLRFKRGINMNIIEIEKLQQCHYPIIDSDIPQPPYEPPIRTVINSFGCDKETTESQMLTEAWKLFNIKDNGGKI